MSNIFTTLNKDARKYSCLRGSVITLEGLIGIGKTTLGRSLVNYLNSIGLNAHFYPEYVNEDFLSAYINNMEKFSFSFQIFMLQKRIEIYQKAQEYARIGGIAIIDRSINGDYTFALMQYQKGFFTSEEWSVYLSILRKENILEPHLTLYLISEPKTSMERIAKRGIKSEISGYTLEYIQALNETYRESMKSISHPLLTINWDSDRKIDFDSNENSIAEEVISKIKNKLMKS